MNAGLSKVDPAPLISVWPSDVLGWLGLVLVLGFGAGEFFEHPASMIAAPSVSQPICFIKIFIYSLN